MKPKNQTFTLATLLLATATSTIAADAKDDPVTSLTKPDSSVSIGIGHVSGEREQFGIYDNLRGNDTVLLLDADVNKRDDDTGTWTTLRIRNLGIDNRSVELGYERQGDWGIGFDYSKIPHMAPYIVNSGTAGLGTVTQTVPATITPGTGTNIVLGTERESVGLNFHKYLNQKLSLHVGFKNEEKEGNRHWGYRTSAGSQVNFLTEPIDSTIRQLEARMEYTGKQLQLTGGYNGSMYDTHKSLVTATDPNGTDYLSSPLDNQAHQFYLNGGYNFTPTTRGTFRLSYTHATMDERLPTAGIAGLANPAAPGNIDGEVNTTLVFMGLTARPMKNLNVVANLRYHKVDDQTPTSLIVPGGPVHVKPNGYETLSGKLEGTYRLQKGYSLIAGVDYSSQDRTRPLNLGDEHIVPARTDLDETTYRVQLRKSMSESINGAIALLHSKRDGSGYEAADNPEENVLNPINIADRDRDKLRLTMDWMATDKLGLQFNYEHSRDDYGPGSNPNGLTDGSARLFSVDADYAVNEDWRLAAWASWDETRAKERVTDYGASFAVIEFERESELKDTGISLGLGIHGKVNPKLKLGADLEWSRTKGQYHDNNDPAITAPEIPLPDIKNKALKLSLFTEYAVKKHADVRFDLVHERWRTNDWTWEFSDGSPFVYGTTSDGTSIIADPKQSSTFFGVRYIYKFQ